MDTKYDTFVATTLAASVLIMGIVSVLANQPAFAAKPNKVQGTDGVFDFNEAEGDKATGNCESGV